MQAWIFILADQLRVALVVDACLHKDEADKIELEKQLERWSQRIALDGSSSKNEGSTDSAEACRDQGGNTDTINLCSFGSKISIEDSIGVCVCVLAPAAFIRKGHIGFQKRILLVDNKNIT